MHSIFKAVFNPIPQGSEHRVTTAKVKGPGSQLSKSGGPLATPSPTPLIATAVV